MKYNLSVIVLCLPCIMGLCSCQSQRTQAIREYQQEVADRKKSRDESRLYCREAAEQYRLDNMDGARAYAEMAIQADETNANAWMVLGVLEEENGNIVEAAKAFDTAAKLAPFRYEPRFNLGIILESVGCYEKAVQEYEAALRLEPNRLEVMENLSRCYLRAGLHPEKAHELIARSLEKETRPHWKRWLQMQSIAKEQSQNKDIPTLSDSIPLNALGKPLVKNKSNCHP